MLEPAFGVLRGDLGYCVAEGAVQSFGRSCGSTAQKFLHLGPTLLDGVEVRGIGGKEEHVGMGRGYGAKCRAVQVGVVVVQDHDVVRGKLRHEDALHEGSKLTGAPSTPRTLLQNSRKVASG